MVSGFVIAGIIMLWGIKKYIIPMLKASSYQDEMAYITSHNGQKYYDYTKWGLEKGKKGLEKLHHARTRIAVWLRNIF